MFYNNCNINKLRQSYEEFKQTSPSYDNVKHCIDDLLWFSHWPCLYCFLGSVNVCGCLVTVAGASTGLTVDALITGWFPFSLAPHTVHRCLYPSVDTFLRRVIVFSYNLLRDAIQNGIK